MDNLQNTRRPDELISIRSYSKSSVKKSELIDSHLPFILVQRVFKEEGEKKNFCHALCVMRDASTLTLHCRTKAILLSIYTQVD